MLASSRKPCYVVNPKRRARSPALQSPCKRAVTQKAAALCQTRPQADAIIGPYAEGRRSITVIHPPCPPSRLCRPFALHCRAGVHARRGGLAATQKGIGRARHRTPPSSLTRCHLPLQGRLLERQAFYKASPARGGGCAARRRRKGALPPCSIGILKSPAGPCPASVGDDACIVPQTLRCRKLQAAGEIARPTKLPQAGGDNR